MEWILQLVGTFSFVLSTLYQCLNYTFSWENQNYRAFWSLMKDGLRYICQNSGDFTKKMQYNIFMNISVIFQNYIEWACFWGFWKIFILNFYRRIMGKEKSKRSLLEMTSSINSFFITLWIFHTKVNSRDFWWNLNSFTRGQKTCILFSNLLFFVDSGEWVLWRGRVDWVEHNLKKGILPF